MRRVAPEALATIARAVDDDDAADILQDLPGDVIEEVLRAMDEQDRRRLEAILAYPEDTAGGLMNLDVLTVLPAEQYPVRYVNVWVKSLRARIELAVAVGIEQIVRRKDRIQVLDLDGLNPTVHAVFGDDPILAANDSNIGFQALTTAYRLGQGRRLRYRRKVRGGLGVSGADAKPKETASASRAVFVIGRGR